jgi:hypothetical protein
MPRKCWWKWSALAAVFTLTGCCGLCNKMCPPPATANYQQCAPCCCQPCCCQPCCPTPANPPATANYTPPSQQWQKQYAPPAGSCACPQ